MWASFFRERSSADVEIQAVEEAGVVEVGGAEVEACGFDGGVTENVGELGEVVGGFVIGAGEDVTAAPPCHWAKARRVWRYLSIVAGAFSSLAR